jgi:hypothetical protein
MSDEKAGNAKGEKGEQGESRRPRFARDFPREAALDVLVEAFERGDYAQVRKAAPELEKTATDEAVKAAARTLVERTEPDPLAVRLLLLTGALLVAFTAWWIVHGKPPPAATQTTPPIERVK